MSLLAQTGKHAHCTLLCLRAHVFRQQRDARRLRGRAHEQRNGARASDGSTVDRRARRKRCEQLSRRCTRNARRTAMSIAAEGPCAKAVDVACARPAVERACTAVPCCATRFEQRDDRPHEDVTRFGAIGCHMQQRALSVCVRRFAASEQCEQRRDGVRSKQLRLGGRHSRSRAPRAPPRPTHT